MELKRCRVCNKRKPAEEFEFIWRYEERMRDTRCSSCYEVYKKIQRAKYKATPRAKRLFKSIKAKCYSPNSQSFKFYGGKGIGICQEWLKNYDAFEKWLLLNGYKDGLTVALLDMTKDFSPENCKVVTEQERGKMNPCSRNRSLTWEIVREIRDRKANEGVTNKALGLDYGVCEEAIWKIVNNKRWIE